MIIATLLELWLGLISLLPSDHNHSLVLGMTHRMTQTKIII